MPLPALTARHRTAAALAALACAGLYASTNAAAATLPTAAPDPCTGASIHVQHTLTYDATLTGYVVTGAHLTNLPTGCGDVDVTVALTGADGRPLATGTGPLTGTTTDITTSVPVDVTEVTATTLTIHRPTGVAR